MTLGAPAVMDPTDVWYGHLPSHWTWAPLKYLVTFTSGGTPSKENRAFWDGDVPWASSKDLKVEWLDDTEDHITRVAIDQGAAALVRAGSILIVVRGMILAHSFPVATVSRPMAINQDLKALWPKAGMTSEFLAWLLRGATTATLARIDEAGHGTKVVRMEKWTSLPAPMPPVLEQAAIAAFLDRETAKIDALVAEQERLMALLKEKRQSVISHVVTKGLNPDAPMRASGVAEVAAIPCHWSESRLKHVVADAGIQMGPFGGMLLDLESVDTGFKVFGQENTMSQDLTRGGRWISDVRYRELRAYQLAVGDILLTRKGSLGNAFWVRELTVPGIIDSDTIRVRIDEGKVRHSFITTLLHDAGYIAEQIAVTKRGAILSGLNSTTIADLALFLPPLDEQDAIIAHLHNACNELDAAHSEARRLVALLSERRAALISAAVTGQIDVRHLTTTKAE